MAVDVTSSVLIRRPRGEVAAVMFDPVHDADWTSGVIRARPLTGGRHRPGSRVERTARFLGRQFDYLYEVMAADGDRSVEMSVDEPFPMHIRYELEDAPEGTVARIRARGDAGGFFRIAAPLLASMVRRNISRDLALLKRLVEGPAEG